MYIWRRVYAKRISSLLLLSLLLVGCKKDEEVVVDYDTTSEVSSEEPVDIYGDLVVNPDNLDKKHFMSVNEQQWLTIDRPYFDGLVVSLLEYDEAVTTLTSTYDSRAIGYDFMGVKEPANTLLTTITDLNNELLEHQLPYTYYSKEQQAYYTNLINELSVTINDRLTTMTAFVAVVNVESSDKVDIRDYDKRMSHLLSVAEGKDSVSKITTLYTTAITDSLKRERGLAIETGDLTKKEEKILISLDASSVEIQDQLVVKSSSTTSETTESVESTTSETKTE